LTCAACERKIGAIRVAARFFSGIPHPHLLGVCPRVFLKAPDFFRCSYPFLLAKEARISPLKT
jgi:hypothetical protein